eukprot:m.64686 g.64686  ORF g.64686 m.64686 type:complete len:723 (+) comp35271_c0_seq1:132-2300(+)
MGFRFAFRGFCSVLPFLLLFGTAGGFDLFIDADYGVNVLKWTLFGDNPLYFVKDSQPFKPTLQNSFLSLITLTTTNILRLTWNTEANETVSYEWNFNSSDRRLMDVPYTSNGRKGQVPPHEVFNLTFPCTGNAKGVPSGLIYLNYTLSSESNITNVVTSVKINCEKTVGGGAPLWIIGVALAGVVALVILLVLIIVVKKRRNERVNLHKLAREITILKDSESRRASESHYSRMALQDTVEMRLKNASRKVPNRNTELVMKLKDDWFEQLESCIIDHERVTFGKELGKGAFGLVYKGTIVSVNDTADETYTVALKTMKTVSSVDEMSRFLAEGIVMKDFKHQHVMGLIGVCFPEEDPPVIILPFMANGDLHGYLKKTRGSVACIDDAITLPYSTLMRFVRQVASGMEYLASQKFVHRDLATRNCMLDENLEVKVGDFGLAKEMHEDLYYRLGTPTKLPVKWMAIESLNDQIFTLSTDVWSFGVTVWEILSLGKMPYPGVANHELTEYLIRGMRPQKPDICNDDIFDLMRSCWAVNAAERPTFSQIVVLLSKQSDGEEDLPSYENFSPISQTAPPLTRQTTMSSANGSVFDAGYAKLDPDAVKPEKTEEAKKQEQFDDGYLDMVPTPVHKSAGIKVWDDGNEQNDDNDGGDEYMKMDSSPTTQDSDGDEYLKMDLGLTKSTKTEDDGDEDYMKMNSRKPTAGEETAAAVAAAALKDDTIKGSEV